MVYSGIPNRNLLKMLPLPEGRVEEIAFALAKKLTPLPKIDPARRR